MKRRTIRAEALVVICITLVAGTSAQISTSIAYEYANIVYPGAILTTTNGINNSNTIVGSFFDSNSNVH